MCGGVVWCGVCGTKIDIVVNQIPNLWNKQ